MRRGVFDNAEAWRGLVREMAERGVGECTQVGDGGIEILVSEKGDEDRLLAALSLLDGLQRRKYKVTLRKGFVSNSLDSFGLRFLTFFLFSSDVLFFLTFYLQDISHHVGPDTRRPGPPKPSNRLRRSLSDPRRMLEGGD